MKPLFENKISATLLYILDKYKNVSHISLMKDYDSIRKISHGKFTYAKFVKLKELSKNTIPHHDNNTDLLISNYVSIYKNFNEKIDPIDKQISIIIKELNPKMLSIPGNGSGHLRYAIMNIAMIILRYSPTFYDYYLEKSSKGKHHRIALSHVCKKLIKVIYYLEKDNIDFNPSLLK